MMLGVARSITAIGRVDQALLLAALSSGHEPARGYGRGARAAFACWERTGSWEIASRAAWAEGSLGCGAAVRVAPIALLLHDAPDAVIADAAMRSAIPTHAHEEAIAGAIAMTVAVAAAVRGEPPGECVARAIAAVPASFARLVADAAALSEEDGAASLATGVRASESVPAALWAFARGGSFESTIERAILLGGDTDSIGAMSGALAGGALGASSIPLAWVEALEAPAKREALALADRIAERQPALRPERAG